MVVEVLDINPYGRKLHIIVTGNFVEDYLIINKKYSQEFTEEDDVLGISQMRKQHHMIIINLGKHRRLYKGVKLECELADTIAHEADHLCNQLFMSIGAKVNVTNDEPHAYLLGWTVKQITKAYLKFKAQEDGKKV